MYQIKKETGEVFNGKTTYGSFTNRSKKSYATLGNLRIALSTHFDYLIPEGAGVWHMIDQRWLTDAEIYPLPILKKKLSATQSRFKHWRDLALAIDSWQWHQISEFDKHHTQTPESRKRVREYRDRCEAEMDKLEKLIAKVEQQLNT